MATDKTWAVTMVRDEADVIEGTIRHMAEEVDGIIVADNLSVDGTSKILAQLADELGIIVVEDRDPAYHQAVKMTALAALATDHGATWVVPFDADELWVSHHGRISEVLAGVDGTVAVAPLYNHFSTAIDPPGDNPFETIVWRQPQPAPLPKIAFRWCEGAIVAQGNHSVHLPAGETPADAGLEVRHFPYRSPQQMVRKALNGAAAYKATDLPPEIGAHWRSYGEIVERHGEEALHEVFRQHFWFLSPTDAGLILDPAVFMRWRPSQ